MQSHLHKSSTEVHVFAPLVLLPSSPPELTVLRQRLCSLSESKARLHRLLSEITATQTALRERKEALVQEIIDYVEERYQSLELLRQTLASQVDAAFESARLQIQNSELQGNDLTALMWTCSQIQQFTCLGLFTAFLDTPKPLSPQELIGVSWTSMLQPTGQVSYGSLLPLKSELGQLQEVLCERGVPLCSASPSLFRLNALLENSDLHFPLALTTSHLFCYFRDAVPDKIIPALKAVSHCSFSPEQLANCESLEFLLTQEQRFSAVDLEVLGSDLKGYTPPPMLAEVRTDHVRVFDCRSEQWRPKVALASSLPIDSLSVLSFLPSGQVFVCGGENSTKVFKVDTQKGFAMRLNDMRTPRKAHGLQLYYGWIYVFGGKATEPISSCEKYSLSYGSWTPLNSSMIKARSHFSPCLHQHLIYLCGGNNYQCEVFNPETQLFTALSGFLPEDTGCRALVYQDQLVVVSFGMLSTRPLGSGKFAVKKKKEKFRCSGQATATIRFNSKIWFTCWNPAGTVFCFDIQTAVLEKTISYD